MGHDRHKKLSPRVEGRTDSHPCLVIDLKNNDESMLEEKKINKRISLYILQCFGVLSLGWRELSFLVYC